MPVFHNPARCSILDTRVARSPLLETTPMMKLYYAPEFSSLADHIAMREAGLEFELVQVDIRTKQIEGGLNSQKAPPPAPMFWPVSQRPESLARNATISAMSFGSPMRLKGDMAAARSRYRSCIMSVSVGPARSHSL